MKRLLALALLLVLVGAAQATSLNFQNPDDFTQVNFTRLGAGGSISWSESMSAGNNYVVTTQGGTAFTGVTFSLVSASPSTYAAATYLGTNQGNYNDVYIVLYDSSKNVMYSFYEAVSQVQNPPYRYEVIITGGIPKIYRNKVLIDTGTPIAQNPSFIGFGSHSRGFAGSNYWDNYVYGDSENKNIMGISESDDNMFIILQDLINPASDGVAFGVNGTQVQSTYMPMTWGRGNLSTPLTNQSIQLVSYPSNTVYAQYYTGETAFAGSINVDIKTYLIDANAPDGYYAMYMPGTGVYSNIIMKKSNGATVSFDRDTYSTGDSAITTYTVASGGYWDSAYSYKLSIYGLSDGYIANNTITTQTGGFTHAWSSSNTPGVYYAILYATKTSTGQEYILGLDWATLSSYVNFNGYVNNAQNQTTITGANVSMTQDGTACNTLSAADGTYNCTGFSTGALWYVNVTAPPNFRQYTFNATPLAAKGIVLNISLEPIAPVSSGIAVGGCDRDTTYGRPIKDALVTVRNITTGLYCYKTTSMTGWYLNDETNCLFQSKTPYDVWAYKVGYSNSTTERAVTV